MEAVGVAAGEKDAPLELPLRVGVTLTSNPKVPTGFRPAQLDGTLEAKVDANRKFKVLKFELQ